MKCLTTFVLASFLGIAQAAIGPAADLVVVNADVSPDGFVRPAVIAQGGVQGVGPLIVGQKDDNFRINVVNNLNNPLMLQSTSIHWHGVFQKGGDNYQDGGAFVNQCPITKGHSYLYDFTAPDQAGTFWYHSHLSTQYCDGLRGPLVIYDPQDPHLSLYDVDDESTVITLTDWYHTPARQQASPVPVPESNLINGLGRWTGNTTSPLAVVTVERGKRYRFRVINVSCHPQYDFSIDGHTFTVIEADGISHEPVTGKNQVTIYAGQRYSLIVEANQAVGNYWIRSNPSLTQSPGYLNGLNKAILRYVGAPVQDPNSTNLINLFPLSETELHPLEDPAAPGTPGIGQADVVLNMTIANDGTNFQLNGVTFEPPTVPVLLQLLSGAKTPQELLPSGSIYNVPRNAVVELTIPAGVFGTIFGGPHPFHLHGHAFSVIRSAGSLIYNYDDPPRRDVVNTGVIGDLVTIRFTTDNPGPWFLHCHIDWHFNAGLAAVFAEATDDWVEEIQPSDAWDQLCPLYDAADPDDL